MSLEIDLSGQIAIVTGAGRGIGRAVALSLAQAGADLCLTARTQSQLEETAALVREQGCRACVFAADATDSAEVEAVVRGAVAQLGGLHILVNNVGMELAKPLLDTSPADYDRVMDTNMKSAFLFTKAVGPHLIGQKYGRVVNMASTGALMAAPNQALYHASKAALAHFTKAVAIEWARHQITVNAVAPGWMRTELIAHLLADEDKLGRYLKAIPARRLGEPEELGPLVAYLCSKLASFMTGSVVVIDGGLTIP